MELFKPDFFDFPYLYMPFEWQNLLRFWPLFFYAAFLCISTRMLVPPHKTTRRHEKEIFLWSAGNSILTVSPLNFWCDCMILTFSNVIFSLHFLFSCLSLKGVLEECGFRFLYVCTAMLGLIVTSWIVSAALVIFGLVLGSLATQIIRTAIANRSMNGTQFLLLLACVSGAIILLYYGILNFFILSFF